MLECQPHLQFFFVVKRTQSFSQFTWLAVVVKLCHKTTFLDFLVVFSLQYILQKLPVQATRPKITNLKKVFASYCLKQDIVLRITNAQLISRFMFAYKQGFFSPESLHLRCYMIWAIKWWSSGDISSLRWQESSDYLSIFSLTGRSSGPGVIWVAIELAITSALVSQIYEILMF